MQIVTSWTGLDDTQRGASAAMGNFDGVHLGHQAVIDGARRPGLPLGVITFEPHPREVFAPDAPPFRLMNAESRRNRLEKIGVDILYELPFSLELAALPPEAFAREVLVEGLGIKHVVVGSDFRFGKARAGTTEMLADLGQEMGFAVSVQSLIGGEDGAISSTAIRTALAEGRPRDAAEMLGHYHRIDGAVVHGEKRGRALGYPTANMAVDRLHLPKLGVYAVKVAILGGPQRGFYDGVASLGVRPMFGENTPNFEVHLFDFAGDLYDQHLSVALVEYLRPEMKFDGLPALIDQMDHDSQRARAILARE
ncbi:bifunctional riboflavin kinase/FMN adenylyltransferase [Pararhodobacter marinus]|uniref:Riboflavin biosynthesis protein n=1 Tax=Pararhodobacter marinus TaxID=2184063 RepID=A0A2U2CEJ1_9RHOB|nr:bifunctional riboflavin kinase/FAD synthetase [Pararhodobacter marinus]PWE30306.1 bifunctional riboflavin kinase/FMN adenylyltransferase [Pararhodobacter marinus]